MTISSKFKVGDRITHSMHISHPGRRVFGSVVALGDSTITPAIFVKWDGSPIEFYYKNSEMRFLASWEEPEPKRAPVVLDPPRVRVT